MENEATDKEVNNSSRDNDNTDGLNIFKKLKMRNTKDVQEQAMRDSASSSGDPVDKSSSETDLSSIVLPSGSSLRGKTTETMIKTSLTKYDFGHKSRGLAHVFVNIVFEPKTEQADRTGAGQDMINFNDIFKRLGFKVELHQDYKVADILKTIQEYRRQCHKEDDCVVFAFSTHGDQKVLKVGQLASDIIYGKDRFVTVSTITEMLTEENCPDMANKPKLFFFQACRGNEMSETLEVSKDGVKRRGVPKLSSGEMSPVNIPLHKDYFVAFASPPGFYAWRRKTGSKHGSWFVTALCEVIKKREGHSMDLLDVMTAVNYHMAVGGEQPEFISRIRTDVFMDQRMTTAWFAYMLTKTVHFAPKS